MSENNQTETEKKASTKDIQDASRKAARKFLRSSLATWKLYKQSKTGLIGMAIVVAFVFIAVFSPWIAPYGKDFRAPAIDTFIADYATRDLIAGYNWTNVLGLTSSIPDHPLERMLVYSEEGKCLVYPVDRGISEETGELGIVIGDADQINMPASPMFVSYVHFATSFLFVLAPSEDPGSTNATLFEYDSSFQYVREYELPFTPLYTSNLWNGYSQYVQNARLAIAFADDHNVWILNKRPPTVFEPGLDSENFVNTVEISNATIVGNPLVVDGEFENGSMLFVPTDVGVRAWELNVTRSNITDRVTNITIGNQTWSTEYFIDGEPFEPVTGNHMMAFPYPFSPIGEAGKEFVAIATTDGRIVSYHRVNGTVKWVSTPIMTGVRSFEITSLYSAPGNLILIGKTDERGLIAGINPDSGFVGNNNTLYSAVDGVLTSDPFYVSGQSTYVFSTEKGTIYLVNQLMRVNATFSAPGGGAAIPVVYVGNIYIELSRTGNYFGVVTQSNTLFVETLTGVNIAPLPPGRYPSGNYYPLGTDYEGHDVLTQVMFGSQAELLVGISAALFSVVIGTIVGLVAGFYSGLIDDLLMRTTDVMLSLPYLVIMLLFAAAFGPSLFNIIIIFAILSWAGIARVIRSVTLSIKERAFVDAAIVSGASDNRLIFRHIGPNVLPFTFLYMTFSISGAIVTEAILAFLGFGDPNNVTWGMMLQFLQISGHSLDAPWWLLPPGIAISLLSLAFYLIGRAFDEVVNPRLRKR